MTVAAVHRHQPTATHPVQVRPGPGGDPLSTVASRLHAAFTASPLPLDLGDARRLREARAQVIAQLDDYVLPRLARMDAPPLVVVGGPTGVGKSTLVNSLVGEAVSRPGLARPTTRSAVLVHHPADADWFGSDRLLPGLRRVDRATTDQDAIQLVVSTAAPRGLAILDAPDFDSVDDGNRALAAKLLAAADLWLFVTSAARYSDQVAWQHLDVAAARNTPVAVVMNRIPPEDHATVSSDLIRMVAGRRLASGRPFLVEHGPVSDDGRLPGAFVADLRRWLDSLAADAAQRSAVVRQAVRGAVATAAVTAGGVADAAALQVEAVGELLSLADQSYDAAERGLLSALDDGTLLRGELLAQWQDFAGSRSAELDFAEVMGSLRERLVDPRPEQVAQIDRLGLALDLALETLVVDHAQRTARGTSQLLRRTASGAAMLDWSTEDLSRPGRGLARQARREIAEWRRDLTTTVAAELGLAGGRGLGAAAVRGLVVALVLHAVAGGRRPAREPEPGDPQDRAAGSGLVAAADRGVRDLLRGLLAQERGRYFGPVLDWQLVPDAPERLRLAAHRVARTLEAEEKA